MSSGNAIDKRAMLAALLLNKHRDNYPTLKKLAYFNYGAQGLIAGPTVASIDGYFKDLIRDAPFTVDNALTTAALVGETRQAIAAEIGARSEQIAMTANTSEGCNLILWGYPWKAGDRLLMTNHEYPGILASVGELQKRFGLKVDILDVDCPQDILLERLQASLTEQTRVFLVSHVLWDCGRILPLKAMVDICHQHASQTRVLVDGAQSVGVLPVNMDELGADYYAFTGHKWWGGPEGVGALYVADDALDLIQSTVIGWRSLNLVGNQVEGLAPGPKRLEGGTAPIALYAGLKKALALHNVFGNGEARFKAIEKTASNLWRDLQVLAEERSSMEVLEEPQVGLIYFRLKEHDALDCVRFLEEQGVLARTIPGTDRIRISVHYLTSQDDCRRLLNGLKTYLN